MDYNVVFLQEAEHDLKELKKYILQNFSSEIWQTSYTSIKDAINVLKIFPESGHVPTELTDLNMTQYRQIIVGMNRVIYELRQNMVYIHIICDVRRDMKSVLMQRLLRFKS